MSKQYETWETPWAVFSWWDISFRPWLHNSFNFLHTTETFLLSSAEVGRSSPKRNVLGFWQISSLLLLSRHTHKGFWANILQNRLTKGWHYASCLENKTLYPSFSPSVLTGKQYRAGQSQAKCFCWLQSERVPWMKGPRIYHDMYFIIKI